MRVHALLLTALVLGCTKPAGPQPAPSGSVSQAAVALPRSITDVTPSSASAFNLVVRSEALHLLWASDASTGAWLHELQLGQAGESRGAPRGIAVPAHALGKVTDLVAVAVGEQLAVAWLEQGRQEARAQATLIRDGAPPALLDLGPAALVAESSRGNIALAAEVATGRALVLWRGLEAPCVDAQAEPCVGFSFRRVGAGEAESTGLPLSVPVPCSSHSVQLATAEGRFHYGVCTRAGSVAQTTMFTIQHKPEYARAEPLLRGCTPLGIVEAAERVWLVGDCKGKRRAVLVPLMDEKVEPENIDALAISCTARRVELRQGRFVLQLREPRAGLESILPPRFVPTGARIGWTGVSLMAVYQAGARLEARSYTCRDGKLQPS